ncbi:MAG: hypothetical protein HUJ56_07430 [Erysipelotrichaceae bacterium]|nr:hypothetical protein [Erysipelotrichaceae bacterium]
MKKKALKELRKKMTALDILIEQSEDSGNYDDELYRKMDKLTKELDILTDEIDDLESAS